MSRFTDFKYRSERFMEKQGFYWLCAFCGLVILGTAFWTSQRSLSQPPTAPAQTSLDETLPKVRQSVPLPSPTPEPLLFTPPAEGKVSRPFSLTDPVYFEHTGHWQLHGAVDYALQTGAPVKAVADGTVVSCAREQVVIAHAGGYESRYMGLISAPYVQAGDPVAAGQTVGHAGQGPRWEQGEGAHLHLELLLDGRPVDPLALFK